MAKEYNGYAYIAATNQHNATPPFDSYVLKIDKTTGQIAWTYHDQVGTIFGIDVSAKGIYIATDSSKLISINDTTGVASWTVTLASSSYGGVAAVSDGVIVANTTQVLKFDLVGTSTPVWTSAVSFSSPRAIVTDSNDNIYVADTPFSSKHVYQISNTDGSKLWDVGIWVLPSLIWF